MIQVLEIVRDRAHEETYHMALVNPDMISHVVVERNMQDRTRISMDNGESVHSKATILEISELIEEHYRRRV